MFEIERESKVYTPVKLDILNLVSTQGLDNVVPMSSYKLVNSTVIGQMDTIANNVKDEINSMLKTREQFFAELRENEKSMAMISHENDALRK